MAEYYDAVDSIKSLRIKAALLKQQILDAADPGRYGRYSVSRIKKAKIHVNAYTRNGYYAIHRRRRE